MRNVLRAAALASVLLGGVRVAGAGAGLPASPFGYAIFALDRVELGQAAQVDRGDVGVNSEVGELLMRARARVAGHAAAATIAPGRNARVGGTMFCTTGPAGAPGCSALGLPLTATSLLPIVNVEAGNDDVKVDRKLASTITPGKYGKVKVGTKARLRLAAGAYAFRSLSLGRGASLLCDGACTIGVDDAVTVGQGATLSTTDPPDATRVRLEIEFGARSRAALRALQKSRVDATVYAPDGIIRLGTNGRYTGAFVAKQVDVNQRARILADPQP